MIQPANATRESSSDSIGEAWWLQRSKLHSREEVPQPLKVQPYGHVHRPNFTSLQRWKHSTFPSIISATSSPLDALTLSLVRVIPLKFSLSRYNKKRLNCDTTATMGIPFEALIPYAIMLGVSRLFTVHQIQSDHWT